MAHLDFAGTMYESYPAWCPLNLQLAVYGADMVVYPSLWEVPSCGTFRK